MSRHRPRDWRDAPDVPDYLRPPPPPEPPPPPKTDRDYILEMLEMAVDIDDLKTVLRDVIERLI